MATINNIEVQNLLQTVENRTGYKVLLDSASNLSTYSDMTIATPELPTHMIRINRNLSQYAEFLTASQCAMILGRWSDAKPLPHFAVRSSKLQFLVGKIQKNRKLKPIPSELAKKFALKLANGLLHQLCSLPAEIIASEICWEFCPSLHHQQIAVINRNLRDMTGALAPQIREQTPDFVFERNASMNSAYALWWSNVSGEKACLVPFESLGFKKTGQLLFEALQSIPSDNEMRVLKVTDAWAAILELSTMYEWLPVEE